MQKQILVSLLVLTLLSLPVQAGCVDPGYRNCNGECAHLPSYPTYEKEACITQCVEDDQAAQAAYSNCLDSQPDPEPVDYEDEETEEEEEPEREKTQAEKCEDLEKEFCGEECNLNDESCMHRCVKKELRDLSSYAPCLEDTTSDDPYETGTDKCPKPELRFCHEDCEGQEDCVDECVDEDQAALDEFFDCLEGELYSNDYEEYETKEEIGEDPLKELPEYLQNEILLVHSLYAYATIYEERDASLYNTKLLQLYKEAAEYLGEDPSQYDVFALLEQLEANQQSMSEEEKKKRITNAKVAYQDILLDQSEFEVLKGLEDTTALENKIIEKREQIKAEYGRILLFDPDNIQANKALGDIYVEEGNLKDAEVFYRKVALNTLILEPETYDKMGAQAEEQARSNLGIQENPQGSFIDSLGSSSIAVGDVTKSDLWIKSAKLAKGMGNLWNNFNSILFSVDEKKVDEAAGI